MDTVKGYSGNAVCVTTRETSPDANLPYELRGLTEEELDAELYRRIRRLTDEQRVELLEFIKTVGEEKEVTA